MAITPIDFEKPISTDQYIGLLQELRNAQIALAAMLDPDYASYVNLKQGAKRLNNGVLEFYDGSEWKTVTGSLRFNTVTGYLERYTGSTWVTVQNSVKFNTNTGRLESWDGSTWTALDILAEKDLEGNIISETFAKLNGATFTGVLKDKQSYEVFGVPATAEAHNCIYRGKEHTVADLSTKVLANNFADIFIGDYIKVSFTTAYGTVTNQKCLIAGINYFKNCGDTATTTPHLVMIPETSFGSAVMNDTNVTTGGYVGSKMHTTVLPNIASALKTAIGSSHVISQRRLLSNATNNSTPSMGGAGLSGASTGWAWTDCDLCLMSEPMVYGGTVWSSSGYDIGDRKQQLPIFALNPQLANTRSNWWLSAVASSTTFALVYTGGSAANYAASNSCAVRPYFLFH